MLGMEEGVQGGERRRHVETIKPVGQTSVEYRAVALAPWLRTDTRDEHTQLFNQTLSAPPGLRTAWK